MRFRVPKNIVLAVCLLAVGHLSAAQKHGREYRMQHSSQFKDGRFFNRLPMVEDSIGFVDGLTMLKKFVAGSEIREPQQPVQVQQVVQADVAGDPVTTVEVRWLGHSTLIIEIEGKRLLTDPVWSKRVSPVQMFGPRRFYPPVLSFEDLPPIDAVLISHDHYDHLDKNTIIRLAQKGLDFYVPLGVGAHLEDWDVPPSRIHEFDWWESATLDGLELVCTPARHFSGRGLRDRNKTLWASWSIVGQSHRVFFSGDSGLFPGFEEIGKRYGPFDLTLMESGAYNPQWRDVHMGPEQAVIGHRALRGKVMIPIHWGLFNLAFHGWTEPAERLRVIARRDNEQIAFPQPGGTWQVGTPLPREQWWPDIKWQTAEETPVLSSNIAPEWRAQYLR